MFIDPYNIHVFQIEVIVGVLKERKIKMEPFKKFRKLKKICILKEKYTKYLSNIHIIRI